MSSKKDSKKSSSSKTSTSTKAPTTAPTKAPSTAPPYATRLIRDEIKNTVAPPKIHSAVPGSSVRPNPYSQPSGSSSRPTSFKSMAPPSIKPSVRSEKDEEYASRQLNYTSLSPQEKNNQDRWLKKTLFDTKLPCPGGYLWERIPDTRLRRSDGFVCKGGNHLVTDEMIVEGCYGLWVLPHEQRGPRGYGRLEHTDQRYGPYYPHTNGCFWIYAGEYVDLEEAPTGITLTTEPTGRLKGMCLEEGSRLFVEWRRLNGFRDPPIDFCVSTEKQY